MHVHTYIRMYLCAWIWTLIWIWSVCVYKYIYICTVYLYTVYIYIHMYLDMLGTIRYYFAHPHAHTVHIHYYIIYMYIYLFTCAQYAHQMEGLKCDFLFSFATARVSWSKTEGKTLQVRAATCTFITGCRKKSLLLAREYAQPVGMLQVLIPFPLSNQHWWTCSFFYIDGSLPRHILPHYGMAIPMVRPRGPRSVCKNSPFPPRHCYFANVQWLKTLPHM